MTKEEILNGMSEEEFYKLFPTEQHYLNYMANGGSLSGAPHNGQPTADQFFSYGSHANDGINIPMSNPFYLANGGTPYYGGPIRPYAFGGGDDNFVIPTNAAKVDVVPANYSKVGTQGNKTFYNTQADKAIANPAGVNKPSSDWESSIIKRLQSGNTPESLVQAGHISAAQAGKYSQYYKPLYTEQQSSMQAPVKQNMPLKDENKIDRKEIFTGQKYKTYQYPDVNAGYSKATTRHFDPTTNQEIDVTKSFDPAGNYVPSYLNNPVAGAQGTLKQTRINTPIGSTTDNPTNVAYTAGFAYGGSKGKEGKGKRSNAQLSEDWAKEQQASLLNRTGIFPAPKNAEYAFSTGEAEKHWNPFIEGSMISSSDSSHVNPYNPNLAIYFNGPKATIGPAVNTAAARTQAEMFNRDRTLKSGNDYNFTYQKYGGYYNSSNYGSFPVMENGAMTTMQDGGFNYSPLSKNDSIAVMRLLSRPEFDPSKYNYEVERHKRKDDKVYQIGPAGKKEYSGWEGSPSKHAAIQEFIARQQMAAGKIPTEAPVFADTYNKYLQFIGQSGNAKREFGGILDASVEGTYPMMADGGRGNFIEMLKTATKNLKKKAGGVTEQGGNQDYLTNMNDNFKSFIQNNVYNTMLQEESDAIQKEFMQMGGFTDSSMFNPAALQQQSMYQNNMNQFLNQRQTDKSNFYDATLNVGKAFNSYNKEGKAMEAAIQSSIPKGQDGTQVTPWYKALAEAYAPDNRVNGLPYFMANVGRGYRLSNSDYDKLYNLTEKDKLTGLGIKYGAGARLLGKTGRKMFGPKEVYFDFLKKQPTIEAVDYKYLPAIPKKETDFSIEDTKNLYHSIPENNIISNINIPHLPMAYGGSYQLGGNPISFGDAWGSSQSFGNPTPTPQSAGFTNNPMVMQGKTDAELKGADAAYGDYVSKDTMLNTSKDRVSAKRSTKGIANAIGQWAPAAINTVAGMFENNDYLKNKQNLSNLQTADRSMLAGQGNRGDYDPNSGMFRPNQMVPVQFPGGMKAEGGAYEEGEEYDLSPEEIAELKAQGYDVEYLD